jgi:hypothetical protein
MTVLSSVNDRGTKIVTITFYDENDQIVQPTSATWTLVDEYGRVINNHNRDPVSPIANTYDITLYNDDHAYQDGDKRHLIIEAIYDNGVVADLTMKQQATWEVIDLPFITT